MKFIYFLILLSPVTSFSQKTLVKISIDKFTGAKTRSLIKPIAVITEAKSRAYVDLIYYDGLSTLTIQSNDASFGCTLDHHIVKILFDDGLSYSAYNVHNKCDGEALIPMGDQAPIMNKQLFYKLQTNFIKAIRIENDRTFFDFDIPKAEALVFQNGAIELLGRKADGFGIAPDSTKPLPKKASLPSIQKS